jgi:hypothetical protein
VKYKTYRPTGIYDIRILWGIWNIRAYGYTGHVGYNGEYEEYRSMEYMEHMEHRNRICRASVTDNGVVGFPPRPLAYDFPLV